jgi:hypothetical protein
MGREMCASSQCLLVLFRFGRYRVSRYLSISFLEHSCNLMRHEASFHLVWSCRQAISFLFYVLSRDFKALLDVSVSPLSQHDTVWSPTNHIHFVCIFSFVL